MLELIRRLDPAAWHVHVTCFRTDGRWVGRIPPTAPIACFPVTSFRSRSLPRQMLAFAAWCRSRRIAIVHATDLPANIFALPAAALARVPVRIANRREVVANRSRLELALQRGAYTFAHVVAANSPAAAERLRTERVPHRRIAMIPNGLDARAFPRREYRPACRRVVVVANLRREKRHDVLIDAAPAVLARFPDAKFEFVGDGPERDRLVEHVAERGLSAAFNFAGHQDDVASRLAAADVFVLPSESEAFPNALMEAMASGLPVVASAVGGITDLVDDGRTGLLVPVGDARALADRLCRLMQNGALATSLGAAGCRDVQTRYSFERMTTSFEALYTEHLARRGFATRHERQLAV